MDNLKEEFRVVVTGENSLVASSNLWTSVFRKFWSLVYRSEYPRGTTDAYFLK